MNTPQLLAIEVKYHGLTNFKGSRVSLSCKFLKKKRLFPYDYSASSALSQAEKILHSAGISTVSVLDMRHYNIFVAPWEDLGKLINLLHSKD